MAKHTVAEELVRQLKAYGVKQIFGITGDALNAFTNAIRIHGEIEWFTVRHEETAGFAASAQAELTGQLAVCAGTIGPGALHLINGLYNAKRDKCPVLAITGQVPREEHEGPYFQEVDIDKAFDDVCVFNTTLRSEMQLPRILQQAIQAAITQRGVAHIALPTDISLTNINELPDIVISQPHHEIMPSGADIDKLAQYINDSDSVSLLIGRGCRGSKDLVHKLAEHLQAPVAHSLKGSECIDYHHPNSIGGIGHVGTPQGLAVMDKCDLLLMLGTDFPYSSFLPTNSKIIQIDIEATHLGRRCNIQYGLVGDVGLTINALLPKLREKKNPYLKKLQQKRDNWFKESNKHFNISNAKDVIHPQAILLALSELAKDDAIFAADIGEVTVWLARHLKLHGNQRLLSSFNHGSLGVGLPAAIGAQALDRKRQVISISGDGGFGMLLADLVTAARYQLPITQIVLNNQKFGFVELEMEASGMPRYVTDLVNPDFAMVANACGFEGITIKQPSELMPALEHALSTEKPVLLDVFVNPNELIIPSTLDPKVAVKFMEGKIREMLVERSIKVLFDH